MISQYENSHSLPKLVTDQRHAIYPKLAIKQDLGRYSKHNITVLAEKFQINWLQNRRNSDQKEVDDSLTNLAWLHSVPSVMGLPSPAEEERVVQTTVEALTAGGGPTYDGGSVYSGSVGGFSSLSHLDCALKDGGLLDPQVRHDYKTNWSGKPPFSYATLICMAMRELNKTKITLSDIYNWITDNFIYYRLSDSSWQNSVRHNLSLNKCFEKVARGKEERGKGGFWRINAKYADRLESNLIKYRRQFPVYSGTGPGSSISSHCGGGVVASVTAAVGVASGLPAASTLLSSRRDQQQQQQLGLDSGGHRQPDPCYKHFFLSASSLSPLSSKVRVAGPDSPVPTTSSTTSGSSNNSSLHQQQGRYLPNLVVTPRRSHTRLMRQHPLCRLQSLDQFRTAEAGLRVDSQLRLPTDMEPTAAGVELDEHEEHEQSPTIYSLLHHLSSHRSAPVPQAASSITGSLDDMDDSAASSSFEADLLKPDSESLSPSSFRGGRGDHGGSCSVMRSSLAHYEVSGSSTDDYRPHDHETLFDSVHSHFL